MRVRMCALMHAYVRACVRAFECVRDRLQYQVSWLGECQATSVSDILICPQGITVRRNSREAALRVIVAPCFGVNHVYHVCDVWV